MIDAAVRDLLAADGTLAALLGAYRGQPAIFVNNNVPHNFDRGTAAYVALRDGAEGPPLDGDGQVISADVDILVLKLDDGDASDVDAAARRIKALLHGTDIAPSGYEAGGCAVTGPRPDDPDDLTFGRRLTATVILTPT